MNSLIGIMGICARHGRALLIAGLAAGILLPQLAAWLKHWLPELVVILLFVSALRIGPAQALGAKRDLPMSLGFVLLFQLGLPLATLLILAAFGVLQTPVAAAMALMLSASPISGSPNLAIMTGNAPAPALRLLVLGTALLPLTVLPVFTLLPQLGSPEAVASVAGRLCVVILSATLVAFMIRGTVLKSPSAETVKAIDGISAVAMAVVVVGLMSAVGPALLHESRAFFGWLLFAFALNFGLQIATALALRLTGLREERASIAIVSGNRNIALFLVALPAGITDPLLLFIGCYQIPMYLTPVLLARLYRPVQDSPAP
ncbi:MAG: hypothetical protein WBO55_15090 [Rhizobiaceae bacterium]